MSASISEDSSFSSDYKYNNDVVCSLCNEKVGGMSSTSYQCSNCQRKVCKHCFNKESKQCVDCLDVYQSTIEREKIENALKKSEDHMKALRQELTNQLQAANKAEERNQKYKQKLDKYIKTEQKKKQQQDVETNEVKEEYKKLLSQNETLAQNIQEAQQKLFELQTQSQNYDEDNRNLQEQGNVLQSQIQNLDIMASQEKQKTHSMLEELKTIRSQSQVTNSKQLSKQNSEIKDKKNQNVSNENCGFCLVY